MIRLLKDFRTVNVKENSLELLSYIEDDYLFPFVAKEENEVWMRITA